MGDVVTANVLLSLTSTRVNRGVGQYTCKQILTGYTHNLYYVKY